MDVPLQLPRSSLICTNERGETEDDFMILLFNLASHILSPFPHVLHHCYLFHFPYLTFSPFFSPSPFFPIPVFLLLLSLTPLVVPISLMSSPLLSIFPYSLSYLFPFSLPFFFSYSCLPPRATSHSTYCLPFPVFYSPFLSPFSASLCCSCVAL